MKRLDFLKSIGAAAILPAMEKENKRTSITHEELFSTPYPNKILLYPNVETEIYKAIEKVVSIQIVEGNSYTYLPIRQCILPIKKEYTLDDFLPVIYHLENWQFQKYTRWGKEKSIFRMIATKEDRMQLEMAGYFK